MLTLGRPKNPRLELWWCLWWPSSPTPKMAPRPDDEWRLRSRERERLRDLWYVWCLWSRLLWLLWLLWWWLLRPLMTLAAPSQSKKPMVAGGRGRVSRSWLGPVGGGRSVSPVEASSGVAPRVVAIGGRLCAGLTREAIEGSGLRLWRGARSVRETSPGSDWRTEPPFLTAGRVKIPGLGLGLFAGGPERALPVSAVVETRWSSRDSVMSWRWKKMPSSILAVAGTCGTRRLVSLLATSGHANVGGT